MAQVSSNIAAVKEAVARSGAVADNILAAAGELAMQAGSLRSNSKESLSQIAVA